MDLTEINLGRGLNLHVPGLGGCGLLRTRQGKFGSIEGEQFIG